MTVSFATFDRLKAKGVEAYKNGDYLAAKTYLVDAAGCMIEMAELVKTPEARRQHEELAAELIDLAKEADRLHSGGRQQGNRATRQQGNKATRQDAGRGDGRG